jgi:hypothetical protein
MGPHMIGVAAGTDNLGLLIRRLFLLMTRIAPMSDNALPDATTTGQLAPSPAA